MNKVTFIKHITPDVVYLNAVTHDCTIGEFLTDLQNTVLEYLNTNDGNVSASDLFWYINKYCDEKYGQCYWQQVSLQTVIKNVKKEIDETINNIPQ